ncbi:MAG: MerR family transcriptional regulator [Rickettsiales bacterium]|jgi:DNA-binding transcriptional MerR regulator|nr:MerR family transcriptional regulator [Rickettsiales bacterium]
MNNEYFLSINGVSKRLDIPAHTLRYWEKQFPAAIKPTTGAGGRRYYRMETVSALESIKDLLYSRGMTIAGVKKLMKEGNLPSSGEFEITPVAHKKEAPVSMPTTIAAGDKYERMLRKSDIDQAIDLLERARAVLV